ncbi:vacuolar sorting protein 1 [Rhizoctonia solani AG-1 IA]|uniref:Vacuolar sorting protein 1 n=1 Tax=Thanatephorus cucumeris (strain AG1-IA) TaxID=983506 RepID=L8X4N0_THACA|nr:vacuolar sorting protein 1 [Rhizoctonia solani AG-1 IA]
MNVNDIPKQRTDSALTWEGTKHEGVAAIMEQHMCFAWLRTAEFLIHTALKQTEAGANPVHFSQAFTLAADGAAPAPWKMTRKAHRSPTHHSTFTFCDAMSSGLGLEVVSIVNKLQDVFSAVGSSASQIDLPQICVVGAQSSGKSSVLENIVGRDFLPRGSGIVTRRPLVRVFNHTSHTTPYLSTYPTYRCCNWLIVRYLGPSQMELRHPPRLLHNRPIIRGGTRPMNTNGASSSTYQEKSSMIRAEIVKDTELKTGKNAGISPVPINLRIFSPNVLTLTLVDLPGLTKVPVGDQPRDIERQIKDMVMNAATTDLANSDGLKLAREVDPEGTRTIGVLTKIDLMDPGTDVVDVLAGRVIPLRLGYVPVVNRGQRDIEQSKAIAAALEHERSFFENHPSYKGKSQYCGTPFLARKLNMILMHHIRATLPDIKARIQQQLQKYNAELQTLGGPMGDSNSSGVVLNVITEFTSEFRTMIDGNTNDLSLNELSGGARISFVFHELYNNGVRTIDPFDQVKDGDIRTILYNSSVSVLGLVAVAFSVTWTLSGLNSLSLRGHYELDGTNDQACYRHGCVSSYFLFGAADSDCFASMQACYVNTTHPDFLNGHKAMSIVTERLNANRPSTPADNHKTGKLAPGTINNNKDLDVEAKKEEPSFFGSFFSGNKNQPKKKGAAVMEAPPAVIRPQAQLSDRETMETEVIKLLITSYFNIVKREMIDMVPKNLQRELLQELYKPDVLDELLKESDYVVSRRKEVVQMLGALNKADENIILFSPACAGEIIDTLSIRWLSGFSQCRPYMCSL